MTQKFRIVLVNTSHPGNIGAAARAMKTMGLSELYLVAPKSFPNAKATELAAGADDILYHAKVVADLKTALSDCQYVIGTSARRREIPLPELSPREAGIEFTQLSAAKIAIVFGRESTGLTNEELLCCHKQLVIPSHPDYSSLNLAQAVQIIAYECRMATLMEPQPQQPHDELATTADVERFYAHLQAVLAQLEFYDPENPKRLIPRLKRLFNRRHLEVMELNILRGILSAIDKKLA